MKAFPALKALPVLKALPASTALPNCVISSFSLDFHHKSGDFCLAAHSQHWLRIPTLEIHTMEIRKGAPATEHYQGEKLFFSQSLLPSFLPNSIFSSPIPLSYPNPSFLPQHPLPSPPVFSQPLRLTYRRAPTTTPSTNTDEMASDTDEDDQPVMEFELPLHGGPDIDLFESHTYLFDKLGLDSADHLLLRIFFMLAALCDPMTQPGENSEYLLSVCGLANAATGLGYLILLEERRENGSGAPDQQSGQLAPVAKLEVPMLRFTLSLKFFELLQAISKALRADDEIRLRHLHNHRRFWEQTSQWWLPVLDSDDDEQPLKLLYYMCCTLIMSLFLMFRTDKADSNMALNPYMDYFVRLWKTHTSIISFALDIDRELEEEAWTNKGEYFDTPDNVKRALLGSSAVRVVLAAALENMFEWNRNNAFWQNPKPRDVYHDLDDLPILDFFDPVSRKSTNPGGLGHQLHHFAVALLVLRAYTNFLPCQHTQLDLEPGPGRGTMTLYPSGDQDDLDRDLLTRTDPAGISMDLLHDIYYDDNLDDDVKYVFGHYDSEDESGSEANGENEKFRGVVRLDEDLIEFDEQGRDWRDKVRGDNVHFTPEFTALLEEFKADPTKKGGDFFFESFKEVEEGLRVFTLLEIEYVPKFLQYVGQALVNTTAMAALQLADGDHKLIDRIHQFLVSEASLDLLDEALLIKPHLIQSRALTVFELILAFNPKTACAIMDELLMINGLRRLLIWFICHHVNLHMSLINYVYELVAGLRGNSPKKTGLYKFSRQGALELSPVEKLMILHELFINSVSWLVSEDDDGNPAVPSQRAEKIVSCLCLMILKLINEEIIVISPENSDEYEDYSQDILGLLVLWIGRIPEARTLYFKVRNMKFGIALAEPSGESSALTEGSDTGEKLLEDPDKEPPTEDENLQEGETIGFLGDPDASDNEEDDKKPNLEEEKARKSVRSFVDGVAMLTNLAIIYNLPLLEKGFSHATLRRLIQDFPHMTIDLDRILPFVETCIVGDNYVKLKTKLDGSKAKITAGDGESAEPPEPEFNDEFLNGEGEFRDKPEAKSKAKKKKKKKTKKK